MRLLDVLKTLRHDLGKYIAMQSRWADDEALRETLMSDLVTTHRSAGHTRSAVQLWEPQRTALVACDADPTRLALLDEHMDTIRRFVNAPEEVSDADLPGVRDAAVAVSEMLRGWYAEVRALG